MTEKTRIQIEEMKKQTIGVEIEMSNISRHVACQTVATYFGTTGTLKYTGGYYQKWTCKDSKGRIWTTMSDGSLRGSETAELVTPILTYDDIPDLQEIVRQLRHKGAVSNPNHGCGVHIHIGANGHTAKSLRTLANIMASHEQLIAKAINIAQSRMTNYCKVIDPNFLQRLNRRKPETMSGLANVWYGDDTYGRNQHYHSSRYHMLNLHATFTKGTIEFRLFQFDNPGNGRKGGLHAGQLKAYIQLCLAMSHLAKIQRGASPRQQQQENQKYAMRTWLLRLGFIGDEFKTARDLFTKRLDGDTAFRHGR